MKRALDLLIVSATSLVWLPLMAFVALLVRAKLGKPVFFRQIRPGLSGRPFVILKFRTMLDRRSATGALLPDEDRLTPFGRKLRASSLDELPELLNVLRGDMSLVGPRPLLMQYLPLYSPRQARRHEVRPGITGWAQINGRNSLSWDEKFELDVWYVDHQGIWLDLKILILSIAVLWQRKDINHEGDTTWFPFTGSQPSRREAERAHS